MPRIDVQESQVEYREDERDASEMLPRKARTRGCFTWLPSPCGTGDLVVAAWSYVVGSVIFCAVSLYMVLKNPDTVVINGSSVAARADSHSDLPQFKNQSTVPEPHNALYIAYWSLMFSSGVLFTFGSVVMVHGFSNGGRSRPICEQCSSCCVSADSSRVSSKQCCERHCGTDLLFGSWLFFLACIPIVPAGALYIPSNVTSFFYWGLFLGSIVFTIGMGFFLYAAYGQQSHQPPSSPSATTVDDDDDLSVQSRYFQSMLRRMPLVKCCLPRTWLYYHLSTDWLAGCWCFLLLCTAWLLASMIMCLVENENVILLEQYILSTTEALIFTVGSMYFLAGSYPPSLLKQDPVAFSMRTSSGDSPVFLAKPSVAPPLLHDNGTFHDTSGSAKGQIAPNERVALLQPGAKSSSNYGGA